MASLKSGWDPGVVISAVTGEWEIFFLIKFMPN